MFEVKCPQCGDVRLVKAKKPWMQGETPYAKICKSCCQIGKEKSEEHKRKLSESVAALQTEEVRQQKSEHQKSLCQSGKSNLIAGQGSGWNTGIELGSPSDETKAKISQSMKNRKKKNNDT